MKTNKLIFLMVILLLTGGKLFSQNWQLVWSDEFTNGISSDWSFETGAGGWGNNELEYYLPQNATVQNGVLEITAKNQSYGGANYTSTRMKTQGKQSWTYGKIEASIALPGFQGSWPAFWMLGDNISSVGWPACGEIDIMEQINTSASIYGSVHWKDQNGNQADYSNSSSTSITGFHLYSIEWTTDYIRWFIDGNKYNEIIITNNTGNTQAFHENFFILLNLAVGGNWPGNAVNNGALPSSMAVDYVRVYQQGVANTVPSTTGIITTYVDCNNSGFSSGLSLGNYTTAQLNGLGFPDNSLSSLTISEGYKVILFDGDNFTGNSLTLTSSNSCLVGNNFNDLTSSIQVLPNGLTNVAGTYYVQNRNSGLYMDVWGISTADGANIAQGTYNGGLNQQYQFTHLGNGLYQVLAKHSMKSVDVNAISTADGANVQQWTYYGTPNQQFIVTSTGDGYYKLIPSHSGKVVEVAGASTANGGNVQQWTNNNQTCGMWGLVPVVTAYSILIQAEAYNNMLGVQTEATTDVGGTLDVGWIEAGDWMAYYNINFPVTGVYTVQYRVASPSGGQLSMDLNAGSIQLGAANIPATGGWQNWTTITQTINVTAGTYNVGIYAQTGGWNINWFTITSGANGARVGQFDATPITDVTSNYDLGSSVEIYPNPLDNELSFISTTSLIGGSASIINSMGVEVVNTSINADKIDVSSLSAGMYTLLVNKDGNKFTKKFIKR